MSEFVINAELNLKNIIAEIRESAKAFNEFADNLEWIDERYKVSVKESENKE